MKVLVLLSRPNIDEGTDYDAGMLRDWILDMQLVDFSIVRSHSAAAQKALKEHKGPVIAMGRDAQVFCDRLKGARIDMPFPALDNPIANDQDMIRRKLYKARHEVLRVIASLTPKEKKVKVIR